MLGTVMGMLVHPSLRVSHGGAHGVSGTPKPEGSHGDAGTLPWTTPRSWVWEYQYPRDYP